MSLTFLIFTNYTAPAFGFFLYTFLGAESLANVLRSQKKFTDQKTMALVCNQCGHEMKGDYEARLHAGSSGHTNFGMKK